MKSSLEAISTTLSQAHYASVSSNEPYAVDSTPEQSALRQELSALYLQHPTEWPEFNYPKLNVAALWESERIMQMALAELDNVQGDDDEIAIMYEQVAVKLAEVYRHLEVVRGLGRTGLRREVSRERAGQMTLEIFGEPNQAVFDDMLHADIVAARQPIGHPDVQLSNIRAEFLELIGDKARHYAPESDRVSYELEDTAIETLRADFYGLFPGLETIPTSDKKSLTSKESLPWFDATLAAVGLTAKGWTSRPGEGKAASTNSGAKEVVVGENRSDFTDVTVKTVPVHEVVAHGLRAQNASEQELAVRQRPLPGYLAFEEGFGMALEQIISGEKRIGGVAYYLSLGLQLGMDQEIAEKRSFKDTYEIMWRRSLLNKQNMTSDDIIAAKQTALQQTMRTTRGGSLDARDISYAEGARKAHQWLNDVATQEPTERQRLLKWVLSGKFDPTNQAHADIFQELFIEEN
ncbi:MAG: tyrosine/phenylalanine carboxypeptidase domain-containing protein [Candidatus Saccharimonadales bacterium]